MWQIHIIIRLYCIWYGSDGVSIGIAGLYIRMCWNLRHSSKNLIRIRYTDFQSRVFLQQKFGIFFRFSWTRFLYCCCCIKYCGDGFFSQLLSVCWHNFVSKSNHEIYNLIASILLAISIWKKSKIFHSFLLHKHFSSSIHIPKLPIDCWIVSHRIRAKVI